MITTINPVSDDIAYLSAGLWGAFERLPGYMAANTCQKYLLTLFFLKAVSARLAGMETLRVPRQAQFDYLLEARNKAGNVERVARAIDILAHANPALFGGLAEELQFDAPGNDNECADMREVALGYLMMRLGQADFVPLAAYPPWVLGGVFSNVLQRFGEFHRESCAIFTPPSPPEERSITPLPIAQWMVRLTKPKPSDKVFDPACGTAGLLVAFAEHIRRIDQSNNCVLFGQELVGERCALSRMHLWLYGLWAHHVKHGDTLADSLLHDLEPEQAQFDVVLSAPPSLYRAPAGQTNIDASIPPFNAAHQKCPGMSFVLHMRASLRPQGGRMAVLLPIEALSCEGTEREIREQLVNGNAIDTIICLPDYVMRGHPHHTTALLLMRREAAYAPVFFVDAREHAEGKHNVLLAKIAEAVEGKREIPGLSRFVSWSEIAQEGFDLSAQFLSLNQEDAQAA